MDIVEKKLTYLDQEQMLSFKESFSNGVQFQAFVQFESDKFLEYQKDLIQDFVADFVDGINSDDHSIEDIKKGFEEGLQNLNTKLKVFADKVRDVDYFPIKGYIQLIVDNVLMTSMIGDVNITIFRDRKLYYTLHNGSNSRSKIDLFSDFVEGDVESHDEILYVGTKVSDVLDDTDLADMESILASDDADLAEFMQEVLSARLDESKIGFIIHYVVPGLHVRSYNPESKKNFKLKSKSESIDKLKRKFLSNKYFVTVGVLGIVILFMLYHVLSQIINSTKSDVFVTQDGVQVDVTIEDIKKDIYMFQSLDPTSDEKGTKYYEIIQKLDALEAKGRWLEDVAQLRKILQADYHKGFNIIYLTELSQFDDPSNNQKTQIMKLNKTELDKLGTIKGLYYQKDMMIAGSRSALLNAVNNNMRGSLIEYGVDEPILGCNLTLLRDGLYCYSSDNEVMAVTKAGVEPVSTASPEGFPPNIAGVSVYGKANMYLFNKSLDSYDKGVLVTRYRNVLGSQTQFQEGTKYSVNEIVMSGSDMGSGFASFAIDSTFLAWDTGKKALYQYWRDPASSLLDARAIPMMGGDKITDSYGTNVKVISNLNSKYIYLFDKDNQTFTVYETRPLKTNEQFTTSYSLYYMFRYQFDLKEDKVIDIQVPDVTGDRPEMYILTEEGAIHKVKLYEFIGSIKEDNVLKQVSG